VIKASGRDNSQTSLKSWMKKKKEYNNSNYSIRIHSNQIKNDDVSRV
jgi:hypothetical protein